MLSLSGAPGCSVHHCGTVAIMEVMTVVMRAEKYVHTYALNIRQLHHIFEDAEAEFSDLTYSCDVRWLSQGKIVGVIKVKDELASFSWKKGNPVLRSRSCIGLLFWIHCGHYLTTKQAAVGQRHHSETYEHQIIHIMQINKQTFFKSL